MTPKIKLKSKVRVEENREDKSCSTTLIFFYKKPKVTGWGSAFLRNLWFEAQKFLNWSKISVFSFLTFCTFQPQHFLKSHRKCIKLGKKVEFWYPWVSSRGFCHVLGWGFLRFLGPTYILSLMIFLRIS